MRSTLLALLFICLALPAHAHFGMVIPDSPLVQAPDRNVSLTMAFAHPCEGVGMDLQKPAAVTVYGQGAPKNLVATLKPATVMDHKAWTAEYTFKRPGVSWFVMQPEPYWEPAEDCFIVHYTKTAVAAFGAEDGWEGPLGLPIEIVPLVRPFGNYAGNIVRGQVLKNGKPLADTVVEVEHYSAGKRQPVSDYHITQVVLTDKDGYFSFNCPWPGWWGFAALSEADQTMKQDGQDKAVEIGGVLWLYMDAPNEQK